MGVGRLLGEGGGAPDAEAQGAAFSAEGEGSGLDL